MKKKTRAAASTAAKRAKGNLPGPKPASRRSSPGSPWGPVVPPEAKATIRRLKAELVQARAQIEQLRASAETDFLLDIPNRRGFERELHRSIAYIQRYRASAALIVLDIDRLKPINDAFGPCRRRSGAKGHRGRTVAPGTFIRPRRSTGRR